MSETAEAVRAVIRQLVTDPDVVEVHERSGRGRQVLEVSVAPEDMGAVIGRGGRTAGALRSLLDSRGESFDQDYELKILEPEER
ncbi:MAG: KH domain-containing protein [Thermoanaerobaculia bacterium]|nr:KH domain-containing protein [Thermoanaerobaculia bacterium]